MIRPALLCATLFLAAVGSAQAQKLTLPVGEWGHSSSHGLNCSPPFLKIEPDRIVKRLGGGEGRCPIVHIKREDHYLWITVRCTYDRSIPEYYLIQADDDDSFALILQISSKILFNNTLHELCSSTGGGK